MLNQNEVCPSACYSHFLFLDRLGLSPPLLVSRFRVQFIRVSFHHLLLSHWVYLPLSVE